MGFVFFLLCAQGAPGLSWEAADTEGVRPERAWFEALQPSEGELISGWRAWQQEIDAEPDTPLGVQIVLAPLNLLVEGSSFLFFPKRALFNGAVLFDQAAAKEDFGTIFLRTLIRREVAFLAGLGESSLSSTSVLVGLEEPDQSRFGPMQNKVIFDSLKRAYRERYNVPKMEFDTVVSAVQTGQWIDWIVVPAAISGYAYRFGIEKKMDLGHDATLQISIERGARIYKVATEETTRRVAGFSLNLFDLPISMVVVLDAGSGHMGFGFIGIGTDLNVVAEAINGRKGPHGIRK
jgi:hypothetical protein